MAFNPELWRMAWDRLPLPKLMQAIGDGVHVNVPFGDTPKNKTLCPFCGEKGKFGVFKKGQRHLFKCFIPECVAHAPFRSDEIGYLSLRKNTSEEQAKDDYIRLALPDSMLSEYSCERIDAPPAPTVKTAVEIETKNIWHGLWKKLTLRDTDREKIRHKRGLSDEVIDELGFRSNHEGNRIALEQLADEFGREQVLAEGIFKSEGPFRPTGQLYGWGITGKKKPDGSPEFDLTEPPLIPYLDEEGIPFYVRPHKGGVRKPKGEADEAEFMLDEDDNEEEVECSSHVYCPFTVSQLIEADGTCVLTEGEFKVAALYQCGIPAMACPGINFIGNKAFKKELLGLLEKHNVRNLVIIFDNEDKSSPTLPDGTPNPKYKADPWKRLDTPKWAEITRLELLDYFIRTKGKVRLGWLPDEHRIDGKADFDGILAKMVKEHGLEKGTKEARKLFLRVIKDAEEKPNATIDLFPTHEQRIIANLVARYRHRPKVHFGGEKENELAARLYERDPATGDAIDAKLAQAFKDVMGCYYERKCPNDRLRGELDEAIGKINQKIEEQRMMRDQIDEPERRELENRKLRLLHTRKAALWERKKGMPEKVSSCTLRCYYKLHTADGSVHRLVRVRSCKERRKWSELPLRRLKPDDVSHISSWKKWLWATGDGSWEGHAKVVDHLLMDMDHYTFQRDIYEVTRFGYDADSKLWFFEDCAFTPAGQMLTPDAGIIWYEGTGYTVQIGQSTNSDAAAPQQTSTAKNFAQGSPRLTRPHGADPVADAELLARLGKLVVTTGGIPELSEDEQEFIVRNTIVQTGDGRHWMYLGERSKTERLSYVEVDDYTPPTADAALFQTFAEDLYDSIGNYGAFLAMGMIFSYFAGPELAKVGRGFPGLWLWGRLSGGKTTAMRLLMRICGFRDLQDCISLVKGSTPTFLNRALDQYGYLPVAFDEFQTDVDPVKVEIIKQGFDHSSSGKGLATGDNQTRMSGIKTTPLVLGVATSSDAQVRSRYAHVGVFKVNRIGDGPARLHRIKLYADHLYRIGACIMANRERFAAEFVRLFHSTDRARHWQQRIDNERVRFVHTVGYAGFIALTNILGVGGFAPSAESAHAPEEQRQERTLAAFQSWVLTHADQALHDVHEEIPISQFWSDVIEGLSRSPQKISSNYFGLRYVHIDEEDGSLRLYAEDSVRPLADGKIQFGSRILEPDTPGRPVRVCYIAFGAVYRDYESEHRSRTGKQPPLSLSDLRREMAKESYFIPAPKNGTRAHEIRLKRQKHKCWVITVDKTTKPNGDISYPFSFAEELINALDREDPNTPE